MLLNIRIIYSILGMTQKYIRFKKPARILEAVRRYGSDKKDKVAPSKVQLKVHSKQHLFPTFIQYISSVDVQSKIKLTRKAGIICTVGPASRDVETLVNMMDAGMDIARLNFSHGSHEYHKQSIENIRKAIEIRSEKLKRPCSLGIAIDTKGPEIRTGVMAKGVNTEEKIQKGSIIRLHTDKQFYDKGTASDLFIDYHNMPKVLEIGSSVYLDDGLIHLKVQEIGKSLITCVVVNGGMLGSNKGINIPGVNIDLPAVSPKDHEDIDFGIKNGIDIVFASFIRTKEDIKEIKDLIGEKGILIVSKIENNQGIENIDDIIKASDGIMVARGDLGIEIPTETVFLAQKKLIASCNLAGKAVICATQMLESMTKKPRPTRAESSDVANAILDGADCVMLSGETAKGDYPVECVRVMADICRSAERAVQHLQYFHEVSRLVPAPTDTTQSIAIAAVAAANKILATAILVITASGYSAVVVSKFRPPCNIFAITTNPAVARKCNIYRGVIPVIHTKKPLADWAQHTEEKIKSGLKIGLSLDHIHEGDRVILLTGWRKGKGNTSTMRIISVTAEMISKLD